MPDHLFPLIKSSVWIFSPCLCESISAIQGYEAALAIFLALSQIHCADGTISNACHSIIVLIMSIWMLITIAILQWFCISDGPSLMISSQSMEPPGSIIKSADVLVLTCMGQLITLLTKVRAVLFAVNSGCCLTN
jgi:hypothetical protein